MRRGRRWRVPVAAVGLAGLSAVVGTGTGVAGADLTSPVSSLAATTTAALLPGQIDQAGGSWTFTMANDFTAGQTLTVDVGPDGTSHCIGATDEVTFAAVPTVTVTPNGTSETTPTLTAAVGTRSGDPSACGSDQLVLTVGSTATTGTTGWAVTIGDVLYDVGASTAAGTIGTAGSYQVATGSSQAVTVAADATVGAVSVTADVPPVAVAPGSTDQAVSPVVLAESAAAGISGTVTLVLGGDDRWDPTSTPAVTASPTGTGAGTAGAVSGAGTSTLSFTVTPSSSVATTYTVGGLAVDVGSTLGPATVTVSDASGTVSTDTVVVEVSSVHDIAGPDADGTAAAELEQAFDATDGTCPGTATDRPVVLATDSNYPDALAGAYLARDLDTGELLTPTAAVSTETLDALQLEGITTVDVVGGPLAVSAADVAQLQATDVYTCGGGSVVDGAGGSPETLSVQQIYGQTEYDTAEQIAELPGATAVGTVDLAGAYAGQYDDTSGAESSGPASGPAQLRTAILATGEDFQDAESASVLAYVGSEASQSTPAAGNGDGFPILLTTGTALSPQAQSALQTLGVQQVIVMGGPLALSDTVVDSVEALGMSVIRVAGTDYTDTARNLARLEAATTDDGQPAGLGWDPAGTLSVARGDFYTDGLAGAVVSATGTGAPSAAACVPNPSTGSVAPCLKAPEPLLLTENPTTVGQYLAAFLEKAGTDGGIGGLAASVPGDLITSFTLYGGPLALAPATVGTLQADLGA